MSPEPTNIFEALGRIHTTLAVLDTKLDALKDSNNKEHKQINIHLDKLNGQVAKNTAFRNKGAVYVGVFAFIIPFAVTYLLNL